MRRLNSPYTDEALVARLRELRRDLLEIKGRQLAGSDLIQGYRVHNVDTLPNGDIYLPVVRTTTPHVFDVVFRREPGSFGRSVIYDVFRRLNFSGSAPTIAVHRYRPEGLDQRLRLHIRSEGTTQTTEMKLWPVFYTVAPGEIVVTEIS